MNNRYAITFGEVSILHVGGKEYGEKRDVGFSCNELKEINKYAKEENINLWSKSSKA